MNSDPSQTDPPHASSWKWSTYLLLIANGIVVLLLLMPPRSGHREGSLRSHCKHNLKHISLGLFNDQESMATAGAPQKGGGR